MARAPARSEKGGGRISSPPAETAPLFLPLLSPPSLKSPFPSSSSLISRTRKVSRRCWWWRRQRRWQQSSRQMLSIICYYWWILYSRLVNWCYVKTRYKFMHVMMLDDPWTSLHERINRQLARPWRWRELRPTRMRKRGREDFVTSRRDRPSISTPPLTIEFEIAISPLRALCFRAQGR
jgi:hypothetical protein